MTSNNNGGASAPPRFLKGLKAEKNRTRRLLGSAMRRHRVTAMALEYAFCRCCGARPADLRLLGNFYGTSQLKLLRNTAAKFVDTRSAFQSWDRAVQTLAASQAKRRRGSQ